MPMGNKVLKINNKILKETSRKTEKEMVLTREVVARDKSLLKQIRC